MHKHLDLFGSICKSLVTCVSHQPQRLYYKRTCHNITSWLCWQLVYTDKRCAIVTLWYKQCINRVRLIQNPVLVDIHITQLYLFDLLRIISGSDQFITLLVKILLFCAPTFSTYSWYFLPLMIYLSNSS